VQFVNANGVRVPLNNIASIKKLPDNPNYIVKDYANLLQ